MKMIIDIDKDEYEFLKTCPYPNNIFNVTSAITNGTPIPDDVTNGQVIQTLFKPNRVERTDDDVIVENYDFNEDWWISPYQKGGKE